jgi:hypothetical protein
MHRRLHNNNGTDSVLQRHDRAAHQSSVSLGERMGEKGRGKMMAMYATCVSRTKLSSRRTVVRACEWPSLRRCSCWPKPVSRVRQLSLRPNLVVLGQHSLGDGCHDGFDAFDKTKVGLHLVQRPWIRVGGLLFLKQRVVCEQFGLHFLPTQRPSTHREVPEQTTRRLDPTHHCASPAATSQDQTATTAATQWPRSHSAARWGRSFPALVFSHKKKTWLLAYLGVGCG